MTDAQIRGDMDAVMGYMHEFYFESAAMILTLITVGKMLEAHSKGKTTDALKSLMKLAPKTATVERDGVETVVGIEQVQKDDIFMHGHVLRQTAEFPHAFEFIDPILDRRIDEDLRIVRIDLAQNPQAPHQHQHADAAHRAHAPDDF